MVKPDIDNLIETMAGLIAEGSKKIKPSSAAINHLIEANRRVGRFADAPLLTGTYS